MKKTLIFLLISFIIMNINAQVYSPFYKIKTEKGEAEQVARNYEKIITDAGYNIIGKYHPENKNSLYVVCFTNEELKKFSTQFEDRGALAAVIRMGFVEKNGNTEISLLNPYYMFYAYLGKQLGSKEKEMLTIAGKIVSAFKGEGDLETFGGYLSKDDLPEYHYKMFMPYFDDPDELNEFDSFEQGLAVIRKNLKNNNLNAIKVYEMIIPEKDIAVFGVGMIDKETGEPSYLPIIGESHIAAMPYEIILQGKNATSLEGKYRFALYWPDLTLGEFMKIKSAPGDVANTFEKLTEE